MLRKQVDIKYQQPQASEVVAVSGYMRELAFREKQRDSIGCCRTSERIAHQKESLRHICGARLV